MCVCVGVNLYTEYILIKLLHSYTSKISNAWFKLHEKVNTIRRSVVNLRSLWRKHIWLLHISWQNIAYPLYSWWIQWNCFMILVGRNKKNSKGIPQVSHSFTHKWKLVTVSNSCPQDKNPPSTVCWRGQWRPEQALLMSAKLPLRAGTQKKEYFQTSTSSTTNTVFIPFFKNI